MLVEIGGGVGGYYQVTKICWESMVEDSVGDYYQVLEDSWGWRWVKVYSHGITTTNNQDTPTAPDTNTYKFIVDILCYDHCSVICRCYYNIIVVLVVNGHNVTRS